MIDNPKTFINLYWVHSADWMPKNILFFIVVLKWINFYSKKCDKSNTIFFADFNEIITFAKKWSFLRFKVATYIFENVFLPITAFKSIQHSLYLKHNRLSIMCRSWIITFILCVSLAHTWKSKSGRQFDDMKSFTLILKKVLPLSSLIIKNIYMFNYINFYCLTSMTVDGSQKSLPYLVHQIDQKLRFGSQKQN